MHRPGCRVCGREAHSVLSPGRHGLATHIVLDQQQIRTAEGLSACSMESGGDASQRFITNPCQSKLALGYSHDLGLKPNGHQ
jgi:hypothetical protein